MLEIFDVSTMRQTKTFMCAMNTFHFYFVMSTMDALAAPPGALDVRAKAGVALSNTINAVVAPFQTPCLESEAASILKAAQSNTMTALAAPFRSTQSSSDEVSKRDVLPPKPIGQGANPSDALEYFLGSLEKINVFPAIPDPPSSNPHGWSGTDEVVCAPSEDYASLFGLKTEAATPTSLERKKYRPPKPEDYFYDTEGNAIPRTPPPSNAKKKLGGPERATRRTRPILCSDSTVRIENSAKRTGRMASITHLRMGPVTEARSTEEARDFSQKANRNSPSPPTVNGKLMRMEFAVKRRRTKTPNNSPLKSRTGNVEGGESFSKKGGSKSPAVQPAIEEMNAKSRSCSPLKGKGRRNNAERSEDRTPRRSLSPLKGRGRRNKAERSEDRTPRRSISPLKGRLKCDKKTDDDEVKKSKRSWSPTKFRPLRSMGAKSASLSTLSSGMTEAGEMSSVDTKKVASTLTSINEDKSTSSGTTWKSSRSSKSSSSSSEIAEGPSGRNIGKKSTSLPLLVSERTVRVQDYSKSGGKKTSALPGINEGKVSRSSSPQKNRSRTLSAGSAEGRRSQRSLFATAGSKPHESTKSFMSPSAKGRLLIEI